MAVVSADAGHVATVLDGCERLVAGRPEVELLSVRRRLHGDEDEPLEMSGIGPDKQQVVSSRKAVPQSLRR